jgi:hypothetical protein
MQLLCLFASLLNRAMLWVGSKNKRKITPSAKPFIVYLSSKEFMEFFLYLHRIALACSGMKKGVRKGIKKGNC